MSGVPGMFSPTARFLMRVARWFEGRAARRYWRRYDQRLTVTGNGVEVATPELPPNARP